MLLCFHVGKCEPIFGRKSDAPYVAGGLQFERHLKKLPHRSRPLNPRYPPTHHSRRLPGIRMRNFQLHPHIFQNIMFRLIAASVAINDQGRSVLGKRASDGIHPGNRQGHGLHDARAAALPQIRVGMPLPHPVAISVVPSVVSPLLLLVSSITRLTLPRPWSLLNFELRQFPTRFRFLPRSKSIHPRIGSQRTKPSK